MMKDQLDDIAAIGQMFQAFADPTRLRILQVLRSRELCVGDLVTILGAPQPTTSRHLAVLRKAGLVQWREDGLWRFYALAPARDCLHEKLLSCLDGCLHDLPEFALDSRRLAAVARSGSCCP